MFLSQNHTLHFVENLHKIMIYNSSSRAIELCI